MAFFFQMCNKSRTKGPKQALLVQDGRVTPWVDVLYVVACWKSVAPWLAQGLKGKSCGLGAWELLEILCGKNAPSYYLLMWNDMFNQINDKISQERVKSWISDAFSHTVFRTSSCNSVS